MGEELLKRKRPDIVGMTTSALAVPKPVRSYFHRFGFKQAFLKTRVEETFHEVDKYLSETLNRNEGLFDDHSYLIAILWGNEGKKMVDVFGYETTGRWPGNPEVQSFIFEDGVYRPEEKGITCGDGIIILGEEEKHRRRTISLDEYLSNPPKLEFNPL